ncbi:MAG: GNAT family N-acetyltransferase [Anaerolineae bacterium]|nr:GNAT family N-acetyltransferase [Anaerolineae bacterium]
MSITIVRSLPEKEWRRFVGEHPQGNIFHTPDMFAVFAQAKGYEPNLWAAVDSHGRALALFTPIRVTLMDNQVLSRFTARSIAYGSVLCVSGPEGQEALEVLLRAYKRDTKKRVLFTELRNLADISGVHSLLSANGFAYEDHLNYLIDLDRPADQVLQGLGKRTRKQIRRGLRDGIVKISEVTERSELDRWYETLKATYKFAQVPLADYSLFEAAYDHLHPKGMAKFLQAQIDDKLVACSIELPFKNTVYGWYGGCYREYSQHVPNELLIWHILEWGANNGYAVYDFGGAGKPDEEYGVRDFKAKFGGELVCYGRHIYVHMPFFLKLGQLGYAMYRKFL